MTTPLSADAERLARVLAAYARPGAPPTPPDSVLAHMLAKPLASIQAARAELEAGGLVPSRRAAA